MSHRWAIMLVGGLSVAALVYGGASTAVESAGPTAGAGVSQLLGIWEGKPVVQGVIIQLKHAKFRPVIELDQLTITDDKYARSQKEFMEWKVESDGRRLLIRLKSKFGDFGSGNHLHITIHSSAFSRMRTPLNGGVVAWSLSTDVL